MTPILNEIFVFDTQGHSVLVAAADSRQIGIDGRIHTKRKLFGVPQIRGAISFWGLAAFEHAGRVVWFSEWLPEFIRRHGTMLSISDLADSLRTELHALLPGQLLGRYCSGFHIGDYSQDGRPEFWYLTNVDRMTAGAYTRILSRYKSPAPDFDGTSVPEPGKTLRVWFRNGDFRSHAAAWEQLNPILGSILQHDDFNRPSTLSGYQSYVKFKFEILSYIYKKWAKQAGIGTPIDVIVESNPIGYLR